LEDSQTARFVIHFCEEVICDAKAYFDGFARTRCRLC